MSKTWVLHIEIQESACKYESLNRGNTSNISISRNVSLFFPRTSVLNEHPKVSSCFYQCHVHNNLLFYHLLLHWRQMPSAQLIWTHVANPIKESSSDSRRWKKLKPDCLSASFSINQHRSRVRNIESYIWFVWNCYNESAILTSLLTCISLPPIHPPPPPPNSFILISICLSVFWSYYRLSSLLDVVAGWRVS